MYAPVRAQGAGALIGAVLIGQLADRFGRRRTFALVVLGYGTMLIAGVAVASYPMLLVQRFLLGIFAGASFPVGVGIYVNLFRPSLRGRLAGTMNAFFSFSIVACSRLPFGSPSFSTRLPFFIR